MKYEEFLERKKHTTIDYGIEPTFYPDGLFDFQKYVSEYAIKKGRCAIFLDTGLGKTIIELTIAHNYVLETNKPVLIITPLAVSNQFIIEAEKFNIPDVEHTKNGNFTKKIILINYERLHYVNWNDFDCVILDESSILKNFEGAIKNQVTTFLKKVKYRFLATATPSPNDYIELGTSSEALGYMGYMDMLGRFFKNNQNNVAKLSQISKARQGEEFYLKPHAENDFWKWVSSWSISAKKPSNLGFNDDRFVLPELYEIETTIENLENQIKIQEKLVPEISDSLLRKTTSPLHKLRTFLKLNYFKLLKQKRLIERSELYDKQYYLQNNPDVKSSGMSAIKHYLLFGGFEGRKPSKKFDSAFYLQQNPDVKASGMNPLVHYILHGQKENRQIIPLLK
jgi:uncharacterized coiled-coil protein SlyX